jgi:predicted phage tail protein
VKTIRLAGELGEKFGAEWHLDVRTPAEAIRAIAANRPGFIAHLAQSQDRGVAYAVLLDNEDISEERLVMPCGREVIHFVPQIAGSGSGFRMILGVALIAASFYLPVGPLIQGFSFSMSSIAFSVGTNLLLGGVAQMLAGDPEPPASAQQTPEGVPSYFFNGPATTTQQGAPVPVGYGELIVGGYPVSAGVRSDNVKVY